MYKRLRAFAYQQLGPYKPEHGNLTGANCLIVTVILVSLLMFTLESDPFTTSTTRSCLNF